MSREKQIEEMAKTICPNIYGHYGCDSCDLYDNECCLPFNIARSLTDKGYRKQSEWISVDERLPEEKETEQKYYDTESLALLDVEIQRVSDEVLVAVKDIDGGFAFVTTDCTIDGKWQNWENGDYTVTHWLPLPEAPKMKGGAE